MFKKLTLIVAGISLLAGCGGGGGSTASAPPSYVGSTNQATITTSNAKALSSDAYTGSQLTAAASGAGKVTADMSGQSALLQETAGILENSVATIIAKHNSAAKLAAATAQDIKNGYNGSISYTITYDQNTGSFTGTITFSQYQDSSTSAVLTGSMSISGVYNKTAGTFTSMNISVNSLTGTYNGKSYTLTGTMAFSISGATKTVTMSVVLVDNVSGRTYWIKDFTLTLAGNSLTVTGTYYDPVHGYVVISTVIPLTVSTIDAAPIAGQLLFSGSNGTKVRLTFSNGGSIVEADTSGSGTYAVVP